MYFFRTKDVSQRTLETNKEDRKVAKMKRWKAVNFRSRRVEYALVFKIKKINRWSHKEGKTE
jgi:hypothetical protein